jgi:hypothetical protein
MIFHSRENTQHVVPRLEQKVDITSALRVAPPTTPSDPERTEHSQQVAERVLLRRVREVDDGTER